MTTQTPTRQRVPLTQIDVRGPVAARQLGRILPASSDRSLRASTFNSAL